MINDKQHQATMTILMTPDMANFAGNVHGGTILKYLDQVAMPVRVAMRVLMLLLCLSTR